ncbi:hypothetical protein [Dietzia cinnamea]|uniref:hypothetical protein n=1 Tax=Dietzia cinnamea TaxID=321318 RepID=UPI0010530696|nr:hypothetical protein [Dietzia cinnamea]
MASAQPFDPVIDGPSSVGVEVDEAGELVVSYDNQSELDLTCLVFVSTYEVAYEMFEFLSGGEPNAELPDYAQEMVNEAMADGVHAASIFTVSQGSSGPVEAGFLAEYDFSDTQPVATTWCAGDGGYYELEMSDLDLPGSGGVAVLDSPSVLTVTGRGTETLVEYRNESGRGLYCIALVGEPTLIGDLYASVESDPANSNGPDPVFSELLATAAAAGKVGTYGGVVDPGSTVVLEGVTENVEPAGILTDDSFDPVGVSFCSLFAGEDTYTEVEISQAGPGDDDDDEQAIVLPAPVIDGPSALRIHPSTLPGEYFHYSYDNRSGRDLICTVFLGSAEYIEAQLTRVNKDDLTVEEALWLPSSAEQGEAGWFVSRAGTNGPVSTLPVGGPGTTETEPHAVAFCVDAELDGDTLVGAIGDHFEIETAHYVLDDDGDGPGDDSPGDDDDADPQPMSIIEQIIDAIDVFGSLK